MSIHGQYCYIHYILPQTSSHPIFYAVSLSFEKTTIKQNVSMVLLQSVLLHRVGNSTNIYSSIYMLTTVVFWELSGESDVVLLYIFLPNSEFI